MPNIILVKVICYVNVENHFLTFTKHITFTRIMLGTPLFLIFINAFVKEIIPHKLLKTFGYNENDAS